MKQDQSFTGQCPTCGQPYLTEEIERLRSVAYRATNDRGGLHHYIKTQDAVMRVRTTELENHNSEPRAELVEAREVAVRNATDCDRHCRHLLQQQAESRLAAANALLERWVSAELERQVPYQLELDTKDHLAAQPTTAPTCECSPADLWDCGVQGCPAKGITLRTEAEQRVLDAMASVPAAALDRVAELKIDAGRSLAMACQFELARRGLK